MVGEGASVVAVPLNFAEGLRAQLLAAQIESNLLLLITDLLEMLLLGTIGSKIC